ncbi:MAG TPA: FecR family protein, partial [Flavisolibacter sp.]|nr:FecR family protein [Flavisolibacter sp.]
MAKVDRYENFTATQLATDEAFIAWVKCPDARSDLFWRAYINRYPAQASVVAKARVIVNEMHVVQEHMEEERAAVIWRKINQTIRQLPEDKRMARVISMRHWWAVAAVLLLMVVGIWIFNREPSNGSRETAVTPKVQQDIRPGKDGAILTLADGRQIELESASNGSLAQQGASNIKKEGNQVVYHQQNKTPEVLYNTMSTPKGRQYALVLSDGSKVWLNAASSIRFPTAFTGDTRGVEITGEAYFEVAHNPGKPFIVSVNNMRVEVL